MEDVKLERQGQNEPDANLILMQTFLENYAAALSYDGHQFYSQLHKFFNEYKRNIHSNTSTFFNTIKAVVQKPPIYSLICYSDYIQDLKNGNFD